MMLDGLWMSSLSWKGPYIPSFAVTHPHRAHTRTSQRAYGVIHTLQAWQLSHAGLRLDSAWCMQLNFCCYNLFGGCINVERNMQTKLYFSPKSDEAGQYCSMGYKLLQYLLVPFGYFTFAADIFLGRALSSSQLFSQPSFRAVTLHMNSQLYDDKRQVCGWLTGQSRCFFIGIKSAHSLDFLMFSRRSEWPQSRSQSPPLFSGELQMLEWGMCLYTEHLHKLSHVITMVRQFDCEPGLYNCRYKYWVITHTSR